MPRWPNLHGDLPWRFGERLPHAVWRGDQLAGFSPVDVQVTRSVKLCTTAFRNAVLEQWP